jgi:phospholipase C
MDRSSGSVGGTTTKARRRCRPQSDCSQAGGTLDYPCVLDLLQSNNISFKNYNFYCADNYSVLALFKNWAQGGASNQLNQSMPQFFSDCTNNTLPQVAFITESTPYDEHPPANIHTGQSMIQSIVRAVQGSPASGSTALLLTYDEGGGFFDHISPPRLDAYGPGIRVPMVVVSPYAKKGYVDTTVSDHSSVLKFHRVCVRPADARFHQSRVRHQHADDEQRRRRGAVPAARW